jgi:hypothetical protein
VVEGSVGLKESADLGKSVPPVFAYASGDEEEDLGWGASGDEEEDLGWGAR